MVIKRKSILTAMKRKSILMVTRKRHTLMDTLTIRKKRNIHTVILMDKKLIIKRTSNLMATDMGMGKERATAIVTEVMATEVTATEVTAMESITKK